MFEVYVASLSDYNAGRLYGDWITVEDGMDREDLWTEIQKILDSSPEAKITGFPAEEWAIHDFEIPFGIGISEWESMESLLTLNEKIEAVSSVLEERCISESYGKDLIDAVGGIDSVELPLDLAVWESDHVYELNAVPDSLVPYIDSRAWLRDFVSCMSGFWIDDDMFIEVETS